MHFVKEVVAARNIDAQHLTTLEEYSVIFAKNCSTLEVTRMRTMAEEFTTPEDVSGEFYDEDSLIQWYSIHALTYIRYIAMRAVE